MTVLPNTEDRTVVSSFVWTKHRNVTDGWTDRHPCYYSGLHCRPPCALCFFVSNIL